MELEEALDGAKRGVIEAYSQSLKELLETKHLYQKVTVDFQSVKEKYRKLIQSQQASHLVYFDKALSVFEEERLSPATTTILRAGYRSNLVEVVATLVLKNVKIYCSRCEGGEVFQPIWFADAANEMLKRNLTGDVLELSMNNHYQMIVMVFQCQRCKSDPEGFLVRRSGHSLFLEGRSPIEHMEFPAYIPKKESRLFRDAVVAFNSGKILGGIFYLRAFIEQFARRQTKMTGKATGDEIMDTYAKLLPEDLRGRIPSLKQCYERLSVPIHLAEDDANIFGEVRLEVERHFDMRRVFSIPEIV